MLMAAQCWCAQSLAMAQQAQPLPIQALVADDSAAIRASVTALAGVNGDGADFLLRQFVANHEDGLPGLDSALSTGKSERARRIAHLLNGSAAAVGART